MGHLLCYTVSTPRKKTVNKILLASARHLGGLFYCRTAVRHANDALLHLKQAHLHGPLGRHVVVLAAAFYQQPLVPQLLKQPVLAGLDAVLTSAPL